MAAVTQVALVESKEAMWEYDPRLPANRAFSGGLDAVATVRTLGIKVSKAVYLKSEPEY